LLGASRKQPKAAASGCQRFPKIDNLLCSIPILDLLRGNWPLLFIAFISLSRPRTEQESKRSIPAEAGYDSGSGAEQNSSLIGHP
jgi:hypothetical protein